MPTHDLPTSFCDDSGAVVHVIEPDPASDVGVILWSARRRQMRAMVIRESDKDSLGFHVLNTAIQEMLRDD